MATAALALLGAACSINPTVPPPIEDQEADKPVLAPILETAPGATPLDAIILRGSAAVGRVIVMGGRLPVQAQTTIDGTFCISVPLDDGTNDLLLYSQVSSGSLSAPTPLSVERDAGAADPGGAACPATDPAPQPQVCAEGDDSCCVPDALDPDDTPDAAPEIQPGTYRGLSLCSMNEDWYVIRAAQGDVIHVQVDFTHSAGDIDLKLYGPAGAAFDPGSPAGATAVAQSITTSNTEAVDFTATAAGHYFARVLLFQAAGATEVLRNDYTMTFELR